MTPFNQFEALDRILKVIKNYRRQQKDPRIPIDNDLVNAYLLKHLLTPDLQFWLRLEAQDTLSAFPGNAKNDQDFKQLVRQFKRSANDLIESWHQSHSLN